jgi:signal transduction histidine kinase
MTAEKKLQSIHTVIRRRPAWRGLVPQLLTIVILPLSVLLVITAFAGLTLHQQSMRELAAERDEKTARAVAALLGEFFQQRMDAVNSLIIGVDDKTPSDELKRSLSRALPFFNNQAGLAYLDRNGEVITIVGDSSLLISLKNEQITNLAPTDRPGEAVYRLLPGDAAHQSLMVMLAVSSDGSLLGVAVAPPEALIQQSINAVFGSRTGQDVYVITPDQEILYQVGEGDPPSSLFDHPGVSQALKGKSGSIYDRAGSEEHIVAYSPIEPFGWALILEEPWETIASRTLRVTENAPLVLIPIVVLALLALWFSSRNIVRPLQRLESRAIKLGRGDFEAIEAPVGGIEEIQTLQVELIEMARKVRAAQKGLHDYIGAITQGQEDERQRLARELHDDTLQSLIALKQRLQLMKLKKAGSHPTDEQGAMLEQIQKMAEQNIQNLRRLTQGLRPVYLEELGLVAALEMLANETNQAYKVEVSFVRKGSERRLASEVELALYRIAQEALNNIVKHAHSAQASLQIKFSPEQIRLEIHDDGKGFNPAESIGLFSEDGHFGLVGMRERAEMIGAILEINSEPGRGSHVSVVFPLEKR